MSIGELGRYFCVLLCPPNYLCGDGIGQKGGYIRGANGQEWAGRPVLMPCFYTPNSSHLYTSPSSPPCSLQISILANDGQYVSNEGYGLMRWGKSVSSWELFQVREVTWVPAIRGVNLGSWLVLEQWMVPNSFDWSKTWKDGTVVSGFERDEGDAGAHVMHVCILLCSTASAQCGQVRCSYREA